MFEHGVAQTTLEDIRAAAGDAEERLLPAECQAVAAASPDGRLVVQQMNQPAVGEVRPEYVTPAWAERLARSLAPVRDIGDEDDGAGLPEACLLLDVLGVEPPGRRGHRGPLAGGRPVHPRGDRGMLRRAVRPRPAPGRAARADRGDHRHGQVRAAADHLPRAGDHMLTVNDLRRDVGDR